MSWEAWLAVGIFIIVYAVLISEKIHRTIMAMIGGIAMIVFGVLNQETAIQHIDFNTIGLLVGMMIIVNITSETGLFRFIALWSAKLVKGRPIPLLLVFSVVTAVCSAFLDNVTTVLLMVPVTFNITRRLALPAMPFLISEILMSNIGGTATMIGDPPNIMIGSAVSHLSFLDFINVLGPAVLVIGAITLAALILLYRKHLVVSDEKRNLISELDPKLEIRDKKLLIKCLSVLGLTMLGFFSHSILPVESATVALVGAFILLLLAGRHHIERAFEKIEWSTLFFFIGLFVLVGGLLETGIIGELAKGVLHLTGGELKSTSFLILWLSAFASAFVDNIPYVATMIPLIEEMGSLGMEDLDPLWWSLSLGACLGGNGTLIGASANVIVSGMAEREGVMITFGRYLLIGIPVMIVSVMISSLYLYLRFLI
ncbi:ArsB/NhaD family transporter [Pullulanibacillus sp. KACC 23026]|uniref:ArsB/NhaD family transporter n=1 Tax=Pullulanibacillus sp. KACC 23026 TaxID=3028315 RepID=UPI0023B03C4A|nr:ArsB/NhaD family transporter [Pullulanibacillus sp. KACC 23026]WEG11850.1 ArsB/NhaD family transporter [Pullulanibacillus sp. KACC 23026]